MMVFESQCNIHVYKQTELRTPQVVYEGESGRWGGRWGGLTSMCKAKPVLTFIGVILIELQVELALVFPTW